MSFSRAAAIVGFLLTPPASLLAQSWAVDAYAGGTRYDPLITQVSTTNLVGGVRFEPSTRARFYALAAAPLDSVAAVWGAFGAASALDHYLRSDFSAGVDLGADAYAFDDRAGYSGKGAALFALPRLRWMRGITILEVRAGGQEHLFSDPDTSVSRGLLELGAQGTVVLPRATAQGTFRWLRGSDGTYPYFSARLDVPVSLARFWGWGGKWLADQLDAAEWGVGASVTVPGVGDLWAGFRQDGADPLYLGTERRSWNVGISRMLGGAPRASAALAPRITQGMVRIRLPDELDGTEGATPSVAGEFSEWRPVAMTRAGDEWILDLPLQSGVYRFSFVSADGEWFVPDRYPGRMEDGFGGWVALLVVP